MFKRILAHIGAGLAAAAPTLAPVVLVGASFTGAPFTGTAAGLAVGAFLVGCGLLHASDPGAK